MSGWSALLDELDAWEGAGRRATFWWRDDDAQEPTPELERLLDLAAATETPLALAVIPAGAGQDLAARLHGHDQIHVLTHGLSHTNHAPAEERKAEFGPHRPLHDMLAEVATGWARLRLLFPEAALPVFVPPWNRIAEALQHRLPNAGILGLSALGPRTSATPASGLCQVNCHIDLINWRGGRGFIGEERALEAIIHNLRDRREARADRDEPTGVMSHHLVHDEAGWQFLKRLLDTTRCHKNVHWLSAPEAFNLPR